MKAIGYQKTLPITDVNALEDVQLPNPEATGKDIFVKVEAISVNPVDTKIRRGVQPEEGQHKILGWDVAGTVEAVGDEVTLFQPGDNVWYAGELERPGGNSEYHVVDERIVSKMPTSLTFAEAAALPLTSVTAWELLFDRFRLSSTTKGTLLIIGAAGGVGSILIQLAKTMTQLTVIATASRPETRDWVTSLGADHVINHRMPLQDELESVGIQSVDYVASLTHTSDHIDEIAKILAPQGFLGVIDDPDTLDIMPFKRKSISIHWELMFTRSLFKTSDMGQQHNILNRVAAKVDNGEIHTTMRQHLGNINASNLIQAHALLESGKSVGKTVLSGF